MNLCIHSTEQAALTPQILILFSLDTFLSVLHSSRQGTDCPSWTGNSAYAGDGMTFSQWHTCWKNFSFSIFLPGFLWSPKPWEAGVGMGKKNANKCKITPFIRFQISISNQCSKQTVLIAVATRFTNPTEEWKVVNSETELIKKKLKITTHSLIQNPNLSHRNHSIIKTHAPLTKRFQKVIHLQERDQVIISAPEQEWTLSLYELWKT